MLCAGFGSPPWQNSNAYYHLKSEEKYSSIHPRSVCRSSGDSQGKDKWVGPRSPQLATTAMVGSLPGTGLALRNNCSTCGCLRALMVPQYFLTPHPKSSPAACLPPWHVSGPSLTLPHTELYYCFFFSSLKWQTTQENQLKGFN